MQKSIQMEIPEGLPKKAGIAVGILALVLGVFFAQRSGFVGGRNRAQSAVLVANALQVQAAVKNFKADQGRYPTEDEFASKAVMLNYLSSFPLPEFISSRCPEKSYYYRKTSANTVDFQVCIEEAVGSLKPGWNRISL